MDSLSKRRNKKTIIAQLIALMLKRLKAAEHCAAPDSLLHD
jgi:hypothetical protein